MRWSPGGESQDIEDRRDEGGGGGFQFGGFHIGLGGAILTEAYLSFLGLGTPPPTPSWGAMVSGARTYMLTEPRLLLAPAAILSLTVLAWNLAGDALRDPRMRKSV